MKKFIVFLVLGLLVSIGYAQSQPKYIGNFKTKRFHVEHCKYVKQVKLKVKFYNYKYAVSKGYKPCKLCQPRGNNAN